MSENESFKHTVEYLMDRDTCDQTCLFNETCPVYSQANCLKTCLIKRDKTFDVFYNLFVTTKTGIDQEIKNALYKMNEDAVTSGDNRDYLNMLVKVKSAFYGPDKSKDVEEITAVNINIEPVPVEEQNKSDVKSKKVTKRVKKNGNKN